MKLQAGCGFWCTDYYPIGGDFDRADRKEGKDIEKVVRKIEPRYKGCDFEVTFTDGMKGAVNSDYCDGLPA